MIGYWLLFAIVLFVIARWCCAMNVDLTTGLERIAHFIEQMNADSAAQKVFKAEALKQ